MSSFAGLMKIPPHIKIILGSSSPRRKEILELTGLIDFSVVPTRFDEETIRHTKFTVSPQQYVTNSATLKGMDVLHLLPKNTSDTFIVVGADTVVDLNGKVLEKPKSPAEAKDMLRELSGSLHSVHTGVAIFVYKPSSSSSTPVTLTEPVQAYATSTSVQFSDLSAADIDAYVATNEPMDKAGSYGIQSMGGQFVEKIDGDFYNVMGLPCHRVSRSIAEIIRDNCGEDGV
jgi:septum formation protein